MKELKAIIGCALLLGVAPSALSSDACSQRAVRTAANVSVSDGSGFRTESFFHSRRGAAIRHVSDDEQIIVVEGPLSWIRRGDTVESGSEEHARFALGHQFHALLLHFDEIVLTLRSDAEIEFLGRQRRAMSGEHPYGGTLHLVQSDDPLRPAGLLIEDPDSMRIAVTFDDWRAAGEKTLPWRVRIDDGERIFDYQFTSIDIMPASPTWFFEAIPAPALDEVQVYRLHRTLLAAHCLGSADLMASQSAAETVVASRGGLYMPSRESTRTRFTGAFERFDYTGYIDLEQPVIRIAESGDLGWIAVNVRAQGTILESGEAFDDQWAWVMMVGKFDGEWRSTGNASNLAE